MGRFGQLVSLCIDRHVYIQTHNFPDPDAIASAFGLQRLLEHYQISSTLCYDGRIDKLSASKMLDAFQIQMLPYAQLRPEMRESDYVICVDSQKNSGYMTDFVGDEVACIDHHPTFEQVAYRYKDIRFTGACASIIAGYFRELGLEPDQDAATALLYGLKMDTLQFTRGVTQEDIQAYAFLFPLCSQETLSQLERNNLEFNDLKAYGAAIESIELYDKAGFSSISFSCPDAMVAILSDFILSLQEVEVAVVFSHREDGIKFSVRSEDPSVHAGELIHAALRGLGHSRGGGHAEMAGGLIPSGDVPLLGHYPNAAVRDLFLKALAARQCPSRP